jgi:hypothetical protein
MASEQEILDSSVMIEVVGYYLRPIPGKPGHYEKVTISNPSLGTLYGSHSRILHHGHNEILNNPQTYTVEKLNIYDDEGNLLLDAANYFTYNSMNEGVTFIDLGIPFLAGRSVATAGDSSDLGPGLEVGLAYEDNDQIHVRWGRISQHSPFPGTGVGGVPTANVNDPLSVTNAGDSGGQMWYAGKTYGCTWSAVTETYKDHTNAIVGNAFFTNVALIK